MKINIPNQITLGRLALAVIFFLLLSLFSAATSPRWLLQVCFWIFLVAALGDILDGLLARLLKQVTTLGRVLDPVADKVLVCGAFVFFSSQHFVHDGQNITGVAPWMVVVILSRELLVSAIRAHVEATGEDFAALWAGKLKMAVQSATVCVVLAQLGWELTAMEPVRIACVWLTVVVTAVSIVSYLRRVRDFLLSGESGSEAGGKSA